MTGSDELARRLALLEHEVDVLKRQRINLGNELRQLDERVDTVFSPPWKRAWFILQGYRPYTVGRWYPPWPDLKERARQCLRILRSWRPSTPTR